MPDNGGYAVHGNVVEHVSRPRFRAIVSVHDGQRAGIHLIEWVDSRRAITPIYMHFMMATALLAWSLAHPGDARSD